jgi:imidazolonepropionase-like amidohydrolase
MSGIPKRNNEGVKMSVEINNVRIFNGIKMTEEDRVVIEDGMISGKPRGNNAVDGGGGTLLPGFIDSHVHLDGVKSLRETTRWGVTTVFNMAFSYLFRVRGLKNKHGLTDVFTGYMTGLHGIKEAKRFVEQQVRHGADFIKILLEDPPNTEVREEWTCILKAVTETAHKNRKVVIVHAVPQTTFKMAVEARADIVTHIPLEAQIPQDIIEEMASNGVIAVPTMVMMRETAAAMTKKCSNESDFHFDHVRASVKSLIRAGVPIIAGTDSNFSSFAPANIPHGISLHNELALYVEAGMTPIEALQSATSGSVKVFGLNDRGIVEVGRRADLVLIDGDPTLNIEDTKKIKHVWIAGERYSIGNTA